MLDVVLWMLVVGMGVGGWFIIRSARRHARCAKAEAERTHGMLVDAELFSGFGCWEHDIHSRRTCWSPGVFALYKRDPLLGPPAFEDNMGFYTPESERTLREAVDEAIQTGKHFTVELDARLPDGTLVHHFSMGRADRDERGVVRRLFGTIYDITERKRLADEVSQAKEAAERASATKSAFIAHLAHEVRTPLTSVLGYAKLIREGHQSPDERMGAASSILRAGEHMLRLINDILDQSKIEAGRMTLEEVACSPIDLVAGVMSMMRPLTSTKGITLQSRMGEDVPSYMMLDPTRMRQVLANLIANAVRFTETGGVSIEVEPRRDEEGAVSGLRFRVRDTGIGMSAEQVNRLFRPFVQASFDTTRRFGGTGLGLSIAKNLVELMGGSIAVSSEIGHGSVFTVEIACMAAPASMHPHPILRGLETPRGEDRWVLDGVRLLLVDDSVDIIRLLETVLKRAGAKVQTATHGLAAVNAILRREAGTPPPDVVLMDVDMPVMSGPEAARRMREIGFHGPVLALTAHDTSGRKGELLEAGYDDQLPKPIAPEVLIAACLKWAIRNATREGPEPAQPARAA